MGLIALRPCDSALLRTWPGEPDHRFLIGGSAVNSCMPLDLTQIDSCGWSALRQALNQRVVLSRSTLVPSRKNRVWVVETDVRPVVLKQFLSGKCADEFEALLRARKAEINVPYPFHTEDDYIVLEYLQGDSCETMINHLFSMDVAAGIGRWLAQFHRALADDDALQTMSDAVLSNFIFHDNQVYGLDLEDSHPGEPLDDLGQMAASILSSEPMFNPVKFDLCRKMILSYELESGFSVVDRVIPFLAKHLRLGAVSRPLFRRTIHAAARSLEREGWPKLA